MEKIPVTTLIGALHRANKASRAIVETSDGFDTLHHMQPWRGIDHLDIMAFFDEIGRLLENLTAALLTDLGDTPTEGSAEIFGPSLHSAIASATNRMVQVYLVVTRSEMSATNHDVIKQIWGESTNANDPHSEHYYLHDDLCEAVGMYPRIMRYLEDSELKNRINCRGKDDYIAFAQEAIARAEKAEKELERLRKRRGVSGEEVTV